MLTPKTIAMNAAKAPHWTLYRRTANRRNHPRTVPMRTSPSWLMSMAFLGEWAKFRRFRIKEPARFSLEITWPPVGQPPQGSTSSRRDARRGERLSASIACPACGTVNAATNTFCVNCGTRLGSFVPAAPIVPPSGPPPAAPPPYVPYPTPYPYYAPFPRRATFSDMLSGLFDVWTKNFLPFFAVYLALGAATGALGAIVLLNLIIFGLVILPALLILVALFAGLSGASALAIVCGGLVAFVVVGVLAIFLYVSLALYAPAIMMENASAVGGLSRSWQMTRGHRWSLFGAILVTAILVGVISIAISIPLGLVGSAGGLIVAAFVSVVSSALVSAFVGSWIVILVAVAYDLLVRHPTPYFGAAPPYMPGPAVAPPLGAAQAGPPPPSAAPPPGSPPGP